MVGGGVVKTDRTEITGCWWTAWQSPYQLVLEACSLVMTQLPEVSPLAIKANPVVAEKLRPLFLKRLLWQSGLMFTKDTANKVIATTFC